jgi:hypothetical protein
MEVGPADERLSGPGGGIGLGCWVAYNTGQLHQVLERYLDRRLPSVLPRKIARYRRSEIFREFFNRTARYI